MSTITINRELPATRCDICHQADCFVPATSVCTRCADLAIVSIELSPPPMRTAAAGFLADYRARMADVGGWKDGLFILPHLIFGLGLVHTFLYGSNALFELTPVAFCVSFICFLFGLYLYLEAGRRGADPIRGFRLTFIGGGFFLAFVLLLALGGVLAVIYSVFPPVIPPGGQIDDF